MKKHRKVRRRRRTHHVADAPRRRRVRTAFARGRRNYKASSGGRGIGAEIAEGAAAFGGGAIYPVATASVMKLANMVLPQSADGTGGAPRALVGAVAAVGVHVFSRMVLGGVAPRVAQAVGHGCYGALGADVGVQALKALGVGDYISDTPGMNDYISAGPGRVRMGDRKAVSLLGSVGRANVPHMGDRAPQRVQASGKRLADNGYGASYGASYG